jgi:preprotein translocase subunit SecE
VARKVVDEPSEDLVASAKRERAERRGPFSRVALFIRQVLAELRKVVTPTRRELFSYTGVVLVFVIIMMGFVYGLDYLFGWGVAWVFGDGTVGG